MLQSQGGSRGVRTKRSGGVSASRWLERVLLVLAGCLLATQLRPWHPEHEHLDCPDTRQQEQQAAQQLHQLQQQPKEQEDEAAAAMAEAGSNQLQQRQTLPPATPEPTLPFFDLAIAVFVKGDDWGELDRARRIYGRYDNSTIVASGTRWTFRLLFVVADSEAPEMGTVAGQFYRVNVPQGFDKLAHKTHAMTALRHHLRFRFLVKTDADTYPCLQRVVEVLHDKGVANEPRLYAGLLNRCGKLFPPGHKLHDAQFMVQTGGEVTCHPMFHQGAFYLLGHELVEYLDRSRHELAILSNEDAMVGLRLLPVRRVLVDIGGDFHCACYSKPRPIPGSDLPFYHFCKNEDKVAACLSKFGRC